MSYFGILTMSLWPGNHEGCFVISCHFFLSANQYKVARLFISLSLILSSRLAVHKRIFQMEKYEAINPELGTGEWWPRMHIYVCHAVIYTIQPPHSTEANKGWVTVALQVCSTRGPSSSCSRKMIFLSSSLVSEPCYFCSMAPKTFHKPGKLCVKIP